MSLISAALIYMGKGFYTGIWQTFQGHTPKEKWLSRPKKPPTKTSFSVKDGALEASPKSVAGLFHQHDPMQTLCG